MNDGKAAVHAAVPMRRPSLPCAQQDQLRPRPGERIQCGPPRPQRLEPVWAPIGVTQHDDDVGLAEHPLGGWIGCVEANDAAAVAVLVRRR